MMDIHLLDEFTRTLIRTYPAEVSVEVATVAGVELNFNSSIEATANSWEGGLVEFTTGDCAGLTFVIAQSMGSAVILGSPFFARKPAVGDQARVYGGPLSEARVFQDDPDTVKESVDEGVRYFITCAIVTGSVAWKGLGGRMHRGVEATQRVFGFDLSVETKLITGIPTVDDMYAQFVALPILKEQVAHFIQAFRVDAQNRMSGVGDIEWSRGFIQRPGGATMRAYVVNFDVAVN